MVEVRAATRLQARARGRKARKKYLQKLKDRQSRLRFLSKPILIASIVDIVANTIFLELLDRELIDESMILASLITTFVAIGVCMTDVIKPPDKRPRFSLAHGIFFVAVLYRLSLKAVRIDSFVWSLLESVLDAASVPVCTINAIVPLLTMVVHLSIFILVTAVGKMSLNLVATTNACPHLLFPFQFFDFVFLYSFFSLRSMNTFVTGGWVVQQAVLQVSIILRNSGTNEALVQRYLKGDKGLLAKFMAIINGEQVSRLKQKDYSSDPLLRLQYLARLGWQFDLADVAALIATPTIVSFFVWRDNFYTLQGTSILVRPCDLVNLWSRFLVLMIVKPAASTFARNLLRTKMRKTLLGKKTMHGTSELAAKIMAERKMKRGSTVQESDEQVLKAFATVYVEEELAAVAEELSISGLNFRITRSRAMKKWGFYLCVIILQLFSAFPVRRSGPAEQYEDGKRYTFQHCSKSNGFLALPQSAVWFYVPANVSVVTDCELIDALQDQLCNPNIAICNELNGGWDAPNIIIELAPDAVIPTLNTTEACQEYETDECAAG